MRLLRANIQIALTEKYVISLHTFMNWRVLVNYEIDTMYVYVLVSNNVDNFGPLISVSKWGMKGRWRIKYAGQVNFKADFPAHLT